MKNPRVKLAIAKTEIKPLPTAKPPALTIVPLAEGAIISEFQADAIELEERSPPKLARLTLYAVVTLLGCAVLWASLSVIDEIVVAPGKLITTRPMLVVQPLETSVIRSINVKVGDTVHAGETLAMLDPTFATADTEQLQGKIEGFDAQIDRIVAELAGKSYVAPRGARPDRCCRRSSLASERLSTTPNYTISTPRSPMPRRHKRLAMRKKLCW